MSSHFIREFYELRDRKLFRTTGKKGSVKRKEGSIWRQDLAEGDAKHLPALVEDSFHNTLEELFIAAEIHHLVTCHTNDGALYLGRRIEYIRLDSEKILYMVPSLNQHGQDAVLFVARLRSHTQSYLVLDHARTTGDEILIIEHFEKYLRRDVVGIVASQHEWLAVKHLV